jgi:ribosomal protein S18 acetylase RimI-like enzyme
MISSDSFHRRRIIALAYHDIVDAGQLSGFQTPSAMPYKNSMADFQAHLDLIARAGIKPITVLELDRAEDGIRLLLTFDDGGTSSLAVANVLEARGWRGHFFVPTSLIGARGFLTREEICDLHRRGHVIGAHSHSHPNVCVELRDEEMYAEWEASCLILREIIGEPVMTASIPGGDMHAGTVITAAQAGIKYLFTSEPTYRHWDEVGVLCLGRICLRRGVPLSQVQQFLRGRGFIGQQLIRAGKQAIKKLVRVTYGNDLPRSLNETHIFLPVQRSEGRQAPNVRLATRADLLQIARIHKQRFSRPMDFLGHYSLGLITEFYREFLGRCVFLVHATDREIDGFVLGGEAKTLAHCKGTFRRNHFVASVLQTLTRPHIWSLASQRIRHHRSDAHGPPGTGGDFRLLSLAVDQQAEGSGVGKALMRAFDAAVPPQYLAYRLSVLKVNDHALHFYEKLGFEVAGESEISWVLHRNLQAVPGAERAKQRGGPPSA